MKRSITLLRIRGLYRHATPKLCWIILLMCPGVSAQDAGMPKDFSGPPSDYATAFANKAPGSTNLLRTLHVEERAGADRADDLVRVPLFFSEGECPNLSDLAIMTDGEDGGKREMPWQADDIRLGPDGGISRVHLWFSVSLKAGERRNFQLVRRTDEFKRAGKPALQPMDVETTSDQIRVSTKRGPFVWNQTGELRSLPVGDSQWHFDPAGAFPRVMITFPARDDQPAADVILERSSKEREVTWESGPLFTKIRVRVSGADGVSLQQDYRIPRDGREVVVTATIFPGDRPGGVVRENRLLQGTLEASSSTSTSIARIPAGIRYALRAEHSYAVTALENSHGVLLAVPLVIGGSNGTWMLEKTGAVSLQGMRGLRRGGEGEKDTLKAFWTEVRLVTSNETKPDELWQKYRQHVQPLVAVVEEPGATVERLHAALRALVREMKPVGWRQNAGRARVIGDLKRATKILEESPTVKEQDPEALRRSARNARAKLTNNGAKKLREDEKGRAYGALDPYDITYNQSAAAALAVLDDAPPAVVAVNYAMAKAIREEGGRVDPAGFPYIDCFSRNLNMQLGPVLFGLTAGKARNDTELVRFYRDLATSPPVYAVFGRGQRPYSSAPATKADQTDYLYQAICDFWLRASELLANENLSLHPLAYSRYTDCIDVMADIYHGVAARDKPGAVGQARANFYRGQAHTHRWLGWSCAPYLRLLENPTEKAHVGLTEAIHHSESMKGRWKNWPDLTYYILADLLVREGLDKFISPSLPAGPAKVKASQTGSRVELSWSPVSQAAEYRIYRAERPGGPFRWLTSSYIKGATLVKDQLHFTDEDAAANSIYVVTAVNADGRESAWPESSSLNH